jgi:hypothetical protein
MPGSRRSSRTCSDEVTARKATLVGVTDGGDRVRSATSYREALRTPWWWYLVAVGVAVLLGAEFHMADAELTDVVPYAVLVPLAVFIVWWIGHNRLEIRDGELRIRGAHLPLRCVSGVVGLDPRTLRRVVGREGDPAAFVAIRPWVGPGVQLWLDDPEDPTPYWIVSSRHPDEVVRIIRASQAQQQA